jgi:predicted phosphodiesterase
MPKLLGGDTVGASLNMTWQKTILGEVVTDYLARFPRTSTKTLAGMIYRDNPQLFKDIEHARIRIRYYRGAQGRKMRKEITSKEHFRVTETFNPFSLPEPDESRQVLPFKLPRDWNHALILSDIHMPYHDLGVLSMAIEYGIKNNIPGIILNGDTMDFFAASKYATDPRKRNLGKEIEQGQEFVKTLSSLFKQRLWKDGNHEERWKKYLWTKAPELTGVEIFELENILRLEENGWLYVDSRAEIHAGNNFTFVHGHEFSESIYSPVNPARGLYLRFEDNAICGHYHRSSHHSQKTGRGKIKVTWSTGCLCLLRPEYSSMNKWNCGFAIWSRESEHDFHIRNFKIIDGKIYEG